MQLTCVLCYVFLTVLAASCEGANSRRNGETLLQHSNRGMPRKRDTKIVVRGMPIDAPHERLFQKSKVIYRRISNQRFTSPKSIPFPSRTPKYRPQNKKPGKKYSVPKPSSKPQYSKHNYEKYSSLNYGHHKHRRPNSPGIGFIVKKPYHISSVNNQESFAEPPMDYMSKYKQVQTYGEPPMKYTAEVKPDYGEIFSTAESFQDVKQYFANEEPQVKFEEQIPRREETYDESTSFTKKYPKKFTNPDSQVYVTPQPIDQYDDLEPTFTNQYTKENKFVLGQKKPQYFTDSGKTFNRHWKSKVLPNEEIIVGGQYAEPPAKYVPIFQPSSPMYDDQDDSFAPVRSSFIDPQVVSSANISPYVNYKNSNMAFSPQNLNDAFSIVDK